MRTFQGQALSWEWKDGVIELALHRDPCNEIGSLTLGELERFSAALDELTAISHAVVLHSQQPAGFCAGADLRELFDGTQQMRREDAARGVRDFLERIHAVFNKIDASPLTTIGRGSWRCIWRRFRVGFGVRFDRRRQDGALLLSRTTARFDSRFWRNPTIEAGFGEFGRERPLADRTQLQCNQGSTNRIGEPASRRRRGTQSRSCHRCADCQV